MASDLTGLLGIVVIAGLAYVVLSSGALSGGDPGFVEGGSGDDPGTVEGDGGSSTCKQLCKDEDCDGYEEEGCTKGCTACKSKGSGSGGDSGKRKCTNTCRSGFKRDPTPGSCGCVPSSSSPPGYTGGKPKCTNGFSPTIGGCVCKRTLRGCKSEEVARIIGGKCACTRCSTGFKPGGSDNNQCVPVSGVKPCPNGYVRVSTGCVCNRIQKKCTSTAVARVIKGVCTCTSCSSGYHRSGNSCVKNAAPKPAPKPAPKACGAAQTGTCYGFTACKGLRGSACCACAGRQNKCTRASCVGSSCCGCNCFKSGLARSYHVRPVARTAWRLSVG